MKKGEWVSACAWAIGSLAAPALIGRAARAVMGLRTAVRAGAGIEEATAAVRAVGMDPAALARIEKVSEDIANACKPGRCGSGPVWADIVATQPVMPGTRILPKSFKLTAGQTEVWVHPNMTKHIADDIAAMEARGPEPGNDRIDRPTTADELPSSRCRHA